VGVVIAPRPGAAAASRFGDVPATPDVRRDAAPVRASLATSLVPRLLLAAAVTVAVVPLSGCWLVGATSSKCSGFSYDFASDAHGEATTARAALDGWLASSPQAGDYPQDGWTGPDASGVFASGRATVTVTEFADHTWSVSSGQACR